MTRPRRDPIGGPLPDADLFSVVRDTRDGVTVFLVAHYATRTATTACCHVEIERQPDESDGQALARATQAIDAKHALIEGSR